MKIGETKIFNSYYCRDCQMIWHREKGNEDSRCPRCSSDKIHIGKNHEQGEEMYTIVDYDKHYKPTDTKGRDLKGPAKFCKLPVKPRGLGIRALLRRPNGPQIFGIWCLLLEAATDTKAEFRGKLLNHKDEPATPYEIADAISMENHTEAVTEALSVLEEMGWVQYGPSTDEVRPPYTSPSPREVKKTKQKGKEIGPEPLGLEKENSQESSVLGLKIAELLDKEFPPHNETEVQTFSRLARHLSQYGISSGDNGLMGEIQKWITQAKSPTVRNPRAMFIQICKKHTGYRKAERIL